MALRPDQTPPPQSPKTPRQPGSWLRLALLAGLSLYIVILLSPVLSRFGGPARVDLSYSQLLTQVENGNVADITIQGQNAQGDLKSSFTNNGVTNTQFSATVPDNVGLTDPTFFPLLKSKDVATVVKQDTGGLGSLLFTFLPFLVLIAIWIWFMRRSGQAAQGIFSFGRSRARMQEPGTPKTTFHDVAGVEQAQFELQEMVDFLRDPQKFQHFGLRVRGDVRRCRRLPRPQPLRRRQEALAVRDLRRRTRCRRPPARRRPRWRQRRAGADPEPASRRDGRLRPARGRGGSRCLEPGRRPRSGLAPARPVRPARRRRPPRPSRPRRHLESAHPERAAGPRRRPRDHRALDTGARRRGSRQPRQRGRPARVAHQPDDGRDGRLRRVIRSRRPGFGAQDLPQRGGTSCDRLPRVGPRAGRLVSAAVRSGSQDHDRPARHGAGRNPVDPDR